MIEVAGDFRQVNGDNRRLPATNDSPVYRTLTQLERDVITIHSSKKGSDNKRN